MKDKKVRGVCVLVLLLLASQKTSARAQEYEQLILSQQYLDNKGTLIACIMNTGNVDAIISAEYHNGRYLGELNQFMPKNSESCFTLMGTYAEGDEAMLVTETGTQIKFKARSGTTPISPDPVSTPSPTSRPSPTPAPSSLVGVYIILILMITIIVLVGIIIQMKRKRVKRRETMQRKTKPMRLTCPFCKNEILKTWAHCPHCGAGLRDDTRIYR